MARKKTKFSHRLEAATRSRDEAPPPPLGPPDKDDLPVELAAFVGVTAVGLLIIMALAIFFGTRSIEHSLEVQTLGLLRANGIRNVEVMADGLELTLVGTVRQENQVALAIAIGHSVEGVTDVDASNVIYVPPAPDVELDIVAEPLVFSWSASDMAVSGTVSDQPTADSVVAALEETWPQVDATGLKVLEGSDSERDWLPTILQVVHRTGQDLEDGTVIANAGSSFVLVNGELETRNELVTLRRDVEEILSALTFTFTNGLTTKEVPPPPTTVVGTTEPTTTTTVPPEVVELQESLDDLIEGKVVEFDFGSAVITAEGKLLLDDVLDALRKFPDVPVEIEGHTDNVGSPESNLLLSRLRAAAVLSYLVDHGENASRFVVIGYGETRPIADNSTAEGRAHNRRIEFTALSE